jgi:hypothetical protein
MFGGAISTAIDAAVTPFYTTETFDNNTPAANKGDQAEEKKKAAVVAFLTLVVVFILLLILGKMLWNDVLIELFPFVKPAKSIWQILGLSILVGLITPGCTCMV